MRNRRSCAASAACSATTGPPPSSCSTASSRARCSSPCPRPSAGSTPSRPQQDRIGVPDEARRQLGRIRTSLEFRATSDVIADLPAQMQRVQGAVMASSHADRQALLPVRPAADLDQGRGVLRCGAGGSCTRPPSAYDGRVRAAHNELRMTPAQRARPDHAREPDPDPADDVEPRLPRPLGHPRHGDGEPGRALTRSTSRRSRPSSAPRSHGTSRAWTGRRCATPPCRTAATSG